MVSTAVLTCAIETEPVARHVVGLRNKMLDALRARIERGIAEGQLKRATNACAVRRRDDPRYVGAGAGRCGEGCTGRHGRSCDCRDRAPPRFRTCLCNQIPRNRLREQTLSTLVCEAGIDTLAHHQQNVPPSRRQVAPATSNMSAMALQGCLITMTPVRLEI